MSGEILFALVEYVFARSTRCPIQRRSPRVPIDGFRKAEIGLGVVTLAPALIRVIAKVELAR
jgi:hypothetical protein